MPQEIKKRKKKEKTEYQKNRKKFREKSSRHVLVLEADMTEDSKRQIFKMSNQLRIAGNRLVGFLKKRLDQMKRTRVYKDAIKQYKNLSEKMSKIKDQDSPEYQKLLKKRKVVSKSLSDLQDKYGVTWTVARKQMEMIAKEMGISSIFALSRAEDIWDGVEKILYGDGKELHFKKRGDFPEIRAKQENRGIPISVHDSKLQFAVSNIKFGVLIKDGDRFAEDEVSNIIANLTTPGIEEAYVSKFVNYGVIVDSFRPCFAALNCKIIRGKLRVYVHITIEGSPLPKYKKDGTLRHSYGKGRVGVDLGTQSIAVVSKDYVLLENLAERNNKSTRSSEAKERRIQRYLDRSRRATNPNNYNENGTIKRGFKKWKKSKRYRKAELQLYEIRRKNALSRKYSIQEMANTIRSFGDQLITEPANAKALQKRAKPEEKKKSATSEDQKSSKKNKRRKRFGKSIQNRCPGFMFAELKKKFSGKKSSFNTVAQQFRASQYDHKSNTYTPKPLSKRWHNFSDGTKVQRDIYSAFLLYCSDSMYAAPDRESCLANFNQFFEKHQYLVDRIAKSGKTICNSGIHTIG